MKRSVATAALTILIATGVAVPAVATGSSSHTHRHCRMDALRYIHEYASHAEKQDALASATGHTVNDQAALKFLSQYSRDHVRC